MYTHLYIIFFSVSSIFRKKMKRRCILFVFLLSIWKANSEFVSREPDTFEERLKTAQKILSETPLIDGLVEFTYDTLYGLII